MRFVHQNKSIPINIQNFPTVSNKSLSLHIMFPLLLRWNMDRKGTNDDERFVLIERLTMVIEKNAGKKLT